MHEKSIVVRSILEKVFASVPPVSAKVATLGGEGREAALWKGCGVSPDNCWLIDLSPAAVKKLAQAQGSDGFHIVQGRIKHFADMFVGSQGREAGLDYLHIDLCGSVERPLAELTRAIEIVERGTGKWLALTVSDQRRHPATDKPKEMLELIELMLGKVFAQALVRKLELQYRGYAKLTGFNINHRLTVQRELSSIASFLLGQFISTEKGQQVDSARRYKQLATIWRRAVKVGTPMYLPSSLTRYIYPSFGFRMRSYLFRFEAAAIKPTELAEWLYSCWKDSDCYRVDAVDMSVKLLPSCNEKPLKEKKVMDTSNHESKNGETKAVKTVKPSKNGSTELDKIRARLAPIMGIIPSASADIERLFVLASMPQVDLEAIAEDLTQQVLGQILSGFKPKSKLNGHADHKPQSAAPANTAPASSPPARNRSDKTASRKFSALNMEEKDTLRIDLIKAMKKGGEKGYDKKMQEIVMKYGLSRGKSRFLQIGTMYARGQGKHRPEFVARMVGRGQDEPAKAHMVDELAKLYGVTAAEIEHEVKAYNSKTAKAARLAKFQRTKALH